MRNVEINAERRYRVYLEQPWLPLLQDLSSGRNKVAIISSEATKNIVPDFDLPNATVYKYFIPDGEAGKSSSVAHSLWEALHRDRFTRTDLIVGVGGGAVTDLSGFVAASWLRGVDWIAVPTTLAGMVDAAIGGKTGINTDHGKNLVGAFHSPIAVIIDDVWLGSLSKRDFAAGLAEVVKCGFILDTHILTLLEGHTLDSVRSNSELIHELIFRAVKTKAEVVSEDFKESHLREILNYGHTFGHAIESASQYSLRHGEAVSIGMIFIAELAAISGLAQPELLNLHRALLTAMELPTSLPSGFSQSQWPELLGSMRSDKKTHGELIRFVVVGSPGNVLRLEGPDEAVLQSVYEKVLP